MVINFTFETEFQKIKIFIMSEPKVDSVPSNNTEVSSVSSANNDGEGTVVSQQDPKNVQELTTYIQNMLQQMQDRFQTMSDQIITRIDDMAGRIDDLEHNINDLMVQAGQSDTPALQEPK